MIEVTHEAVYNTKVSSIVLQNDDQIKYKQNVLGNVTVLL